MKLRYTFLFSSCWTRAIRAQRCPATEKQQLGNAQHQILQRFIRSPVLNPFKRSTCEKFFFSWRYRQNSYFFSLLNIEMRCLYCFTAVFHKNVIQPLNLYKFNFHDFKLCLSQIIVCKWTRSPLQFISPCIIYYFYEINFDLVLFLVIIRGFWRVPNCLRLSHLNWKEMSNMNPMKNKNNNLPAALNTE